MAENEGSGAPENAEVVPQGQGEPAERSFTQAEVDRMITERVSRAKATPPADYAELRAASQRLAAIEDRDKTELQRAQTSLAAAEARIKAAQTDYSGRLLRAQFDTMAARRNPDVNTNEILEYIDLSRLVDANGDPDMKALEAAVKRLVPEANGAPPAFEGGARGKPVKPSDMNEMIRLAAGR